jgi:hypothetical protein
LSEKLCQNNNKKISGLRVGKIPHYIYNTVYEKAFRKSIKLGAMGKMAE